MDVTFGIVAALLGYDFIVFLFSLGGFLFYEENLQTMMMFMLLGMVVGGIVFLLTLGML